LIRQRALKIETSSCDKSKVKNNLSVVIKREETKMTRMTRKTKKNKLNIKNKKSKLRKKEKSKNKPK
jgi:hypothetical protein